MALFKKNTEPPKTESQLAYEHKKQCDDEYQQTLKNTVPDPHIKVIHTGDTGPLDKGKSYYFWIADQAACFFPSLNALHDDLDTVKKAAAFCLRNVSIANKNTTTTLQDKDHAMLTQYSIEPLLFTLNGEDRNGQSLQIQVRVTNNLDNIQYLNHYIEPQLLPYHNCLTRPDKTYPARCIQGDGYIGNYTFELWLEKNSLVLLRKNTTVAHVAYKSTVDIARIPLGRIEFYRSNGEVNYENTITGGSMNITADIYGVSFKGKATLNKIDNERVVHDSRHTQLSLLDNAQRVSILFDLDSFQTFEKLIPHKNYDTMLLNASNAKAAGSPDASYDEIIKLLKELGALKDAGILTDEEFHDKKKILLDKIR